ncbi:MAG: hypothetical protein JWQ58_661 [Reyranella sp.]|nr:hypothetical protein [Reyranella sp.]
MSEERKKVLQRFHERLAHLEAGALSGPAHWHIFHLHNALNALPDDHAAADLHLDEFDRADLAKEFPEMDADKAPTVSEIRSRFDMLAGGTL